MTHRDPKYLFVKTLTSLTNSISTERSERISNTSYALSKWPHLHRASFESSRGLHVLLDYGDVLVRTFLIVSNSRWNLHGIHLRAETEQQSPFTKFTIPKKEFYKELTYNPDNDTYLIPSDYLTGSFPAIVKTLQVRFSQIVIQFTTKSNHIKRFGESIGWGQMP